MDLKDICAILEDRYVELSRLAGDDMAISIDWYDGARSELKRTIELLQRHLTSKCSGQNIRCANCGEPIIGDIICLDCEKYSP